MKYNKYGDKVNVSNAIHHEMRMNRWGKTHSAQDIVWLLREYQGLYVSETTVRKYLWQMVDAGAAETWAGNPASNGTHRRRHFKLKPGY